MKIRLIENAYCAGNYLRLPTEDGEASTYALQGRWYEAAAVDEDGNNYTVYWEPLSNWNGEDEGDACNWDKPVAVVQCDPWRDVTKQIVEIEH